MPNFSFTDDKASRDDEEEKEQERLAKRFAKRARMQRLLETHGEDKEFSQIRLIDEDESMKNDLMKMKVRIGLSHSPIVFLVLYLNLER